MLPTFIVIGAMKAGTTSLYHYLSQHPEIGMSRHKELNFFKTNADFAKGLDWYAAQFPSGSRVLGESSPNYSKCHLFPGVAERLHSVLPRISLIYLVRHPVDRAVSHYVHQVSTGKESRPFEAVFEDLEQNPYVLTGAYMFQLRQYLRFYPAERMLIV
ncbi:MAG: sulfotransferase domain-containing protein, partial [Pseudomonadota bacterium]|nr:sulfotransferase domain-containing protein [Pseudomonadota bacterium]